MTEVFTFVPKVSQREAAFKEYPLFVSLLISNNNLGQFSLTVMLFTLSLVSHLLVQVLISANISIIDILSSKGYVTKNSFLYFCSSSNLPLAFNNSKCAWYLWFPSTSTIYLWASSLEITSPVIKSTISKSCSTALFPFTITAGVNTPHFFKDSFFCLTFLGSRSLLATNLATFLPSFNTSTCFIFFSIKIYRCPADLYWFLAHQLFVSGAKMKQ